MVEFCSIQSTNLFIQKVRIIMALKIYTKTGDLGKTTLIGGTKVPKSHIRIDSYGTVDELNAYIGLVTDYFEDEKSGVVLKEIPDRLFTIGSSLACDPEAEPTMKIPDLVDADVLFLENEIDKMNEVLLPMKNFILPGGHIAVSTAHVARCVCRRAERCCVNMQENNLFVEPLVIKYLNRLGDYIFVLSRYIGHVLNIQEVKWMPRISKKI